MDISALIRITLYIVFLYSENLLDAAALSFVWREESAAELACRFLSFFVRVLVSMLRIKNEENDQDSPITHLHA